MDAAVVVVVANLSGERILTADRNGPLLTTLIGRQMRHQRRIRQIDRAETAPGDVRVTGADFDVANVSGAGGDDLRRLGCIRLSAEEQPARQSVTPVERAGTYPSHVRNADNPPPAEVTVRHGDLIRGTRER